MAEIVRVQPPKMDKLTGKSGKNVLMFQCVWPLQKAAATKNPQSCFDFDKTEWKPLILFAPDEGSIASISVGFLFGSVLFYLRREKAKHKNVLFESYNGFYMTK